MVDSISTYGDYDLQVTLIETVFRMYGKNTITSKLKDLIPESQLLSESFAEINGDTFDEDVRKFLNALNETSGKVFSVICKSVYLGNIKCGEPTDNGLWVDFNLSENAVTWYCNKNSLSDKRIDGENVNESDNKVWNLVTLFVADVESVQIHRPIKSEDVLIFFKFKESCISSFDDNQAIVGAANNLKLVVSRESKKIAILLSKVLPSMFKNKFFHNSSKVSSSKMSVYKPLNVTVSRKTKSDSSKTKSDNSSFFTFFDPISARSSKNDLNSTLRSLRKGFSISSMSPKCEVISILDSSTPTTELSLEFMPIKDQLSKNIRSIDNENKNEYEITANCPNACFEAKTKVSKYIQDVDILNINKIVDIKISKAKINNTASTNSSFNDELLTVQEDIDHIQILSRRCSGSNVRYSQLSKISRLTTSPPRKISSFSRRYDDEINENKIIYSGQSTEDITKWNKIKIQESSTQNFQTANENTQNKIQESSTQNFQTANENTQNLNSPIKVSNTKDILNKADICRENLVCTPMDLEYQYVYKQNFQETADYDLNLKKADKISKPKDVSNNASDMSGTSKNCRCTINTNIDRESDLCNPTEGTFISQDPIIRDIKSNPENNYSKIHEDLIVEEGFESTKVKIPQLNRESVLICDNENHLMCEITQDIEKDPTLIYISKSIYSGSNKSEIKPIRRTCQTLVKENDVTIAELDVSNSNTILKENIFGKSKLIETNSKCHKTYIKSNTAMSINSTKKTKKGHIKTTINWSNKLIREDSNKENLERLERIDLLTEPVEKMIQETELQKNVKSRELCMKEVDIHIKSIDKNIKETQSNIDFANENSHMALTCTSDILSEDEIPLKQLMKKWKEEKLKRTEYSEQVTKANQNLHDFKEIDLKITNNCETTVVDLKRETLIKNENSQLQIINRGNDNLVSKPGETLKCFVGILENSEGSLNHKKIRESHDISEMDEQARDLSKIIPNNIHTDIKRNDKENKKTDEQQITDQNKDKTIKNAQILQEKNSRGTDVNQSDVTKDLNQTVSTTLEVRKKRKLYNPEDLTYLEEPSLLDKKSRELIQIKSPIEHNSKMIDLKHFEGKKYIYNTVIPINDRNKKRSQKGSTTFKSSKKLKVVNPDITLKIINNKNKRYRQLRPVFHNLLESFRKEITPMKDKVNKDEYRKNVSKSATCVKKNRLIKVDIGIRTTQKPSILSNSSSDVSLNLRKDICTNEDHDTSPILTSKNDSPPEMQIEQQNNEKKINIISNIQIKPKRMLLKDKTEPPKKKIKADVKSSLFQETSEFENVAESLQVKNICEKIIPFKMSEGPIISETMTHEEIDSWITTGEFSVF